MFKFATVSPTCNLGNFLEHVVYGEAYEAVLPFNSNRSSELFAVAEAQRQVTFAGALITIISLAS